jgi:hypothetical protein
MNNESERILKETVNALIEVIFQNFAGRTEKNHENLQSG